MKYKVVGCELREGDFRDPKTNVDTHYSYYLLHVVSVERAKDPIFGVCPEQIKLRKKFVDDNEINLKSFNQKIVEVYYDAYRNVAKIDIVE